MRALLLCVFAVAFGADNDSSDLAKTLYSGNLSLGVIEQQGVFFTNYPTAQQESDTFLSVKRGNSALQFTGIGLLKSNYDPTHMNIKDPAFMFNIKLSGDNIELGGSVRDLSIGDWTDLASEIVGKSKESK
jgi:hypothetical protein